MWLRLGHRGEVDAFGNIGRRLLDGLKITAIGALFADLEGGQQTLCAQTDLAIGL